MKGARVLLVEDDAGAAEVVSRALTMAGHRVTHASTAEEAVRVLRESAFDFILLDVVLPGKTGLQALAEMTRLTRAPIHMMSGQDAEDVLTDALLLGAKGFFPKPVDFAAIVAAIAALPPAR